MKTSMKFENPFNYLLLLLMALILSLALNSCKDDDNGPNTEKEITVKMSSQQEIPPVKDRSETGTASLRLKSDSTLEFEIRVANLTQTDQLTIAHVHEAGPVDAGAPVITLVDNSTTKFNGSSVSGSVKVNKKQYENILKNSNDFYVNVHSSNYPLGLLRGQMGADIIFAANVELVPGTLRPETGLAILRLQSDSLLFYKITVNNLTTGDSLKTASINVGATGVTGPVLINLASNSNDFDVEKYIKLTSSEVNFLLNSEIYINVTSSQSSQEMLRGQIR